MKFHFSDLSKFILGGTLHDVLPVFSPPPPPANITIATSHRRLAPLVSTTTTVLALSPVRQHPFPVPRGHGRAGHAEPPGRPPGHPRRRRRGADNDGVAKAGGGQEEGRLARYDFMQIIRVIISLRHWIS